MKKRKIAFKVVASVLSLCFYLFMATGSDESSSDSPKREEPVYTPSKPIEKEPTKPIEKEPIFSNDELEEEQDTILMKDTYDNDDILEE